MTLWLYQLNPQKTLEDGGTYTTLDLKKDIEDNKYLQWRTRNILPQNARPQAGDTLIYWLVKTGSKKPGIGGIGVIYSLYYTFYEENQQEYKESWIKHHPVYPSLALIQKPIYNQPLQKTINLVRNKRFRHATMFKVDEIYAQTIFEYIETRLEYI